MADTVEREFVVAAKVLNLPVKTGAEKRVLHLLVDGEVVRELVVELATGEPDFWTGLDVDAFRGKTVVLRADGGGADVLAAVTPGDAVTGTEDLYRETNRPQFHFSPARGWTNDPNGCMFYKGEYHLFFQHNPFGWAWGNMTWGHAVSTDLVHWTEIGDALHPDALGTMFSGSGVVDTENTTGFKTGDEDPMVCIYTSAGGTNPWSKDQPFTQSIAYSNDRGRTWQAYEKNPVVGHIIGSNRDPKVIWHAPSKRWVMVLYLEGNDYAVFHSPDLKEWTQACDVTLPNASECPDIFGVARRWKRRRHALGLLGRQRHLPGGRLRRLLLPDGGPAPTL
jgi:hypothetical protein